MENLDADLDKYFTAVEKDPSVLAADSQRRETGDGTGQSVPHWESHLEELIRNEKGGGDVENTDVVNATKETTSAQATQKSSPEEEKVELHQPQSPQQKSSQENPTQQTTAQDPSFQQDSSRQHSIQQTAMQQNLFSATGQQPTAPTITKTANSPRSRKRAAAEDKKWIIELSSDEDEPNKDATAPVTKRTKPNNSTLASRQAAIAAFENRQKHLPEWMGSKSAAATALTRPGVPPQVRYPNGWRTPSYPGLSQALKPPPSTMVSSSNGGGASALTSTAPTSAPPRTTTSSLPSAAVPSNGTVRPPSQGWKSSTNIPQSIYPEDKPLFFSIPPTFKATWSHILPIEEAKQAAQPTRTTQQRRFQLSLLNVNEFTITGLPASLDGIPTPLSGLRLPIKQISKKHGTAVFDQSKDPNAENASEAEEGRWRIPLGAYQDFMAFLASEENTFVEGIPQHQLQIASLERARQEKGYPSVEDILKLGIPNGLANALAPFQRGGVGFVVDKNGRALIADDMGLGKTIQAIASMTAYFNEWPVLVLTPSTARYHWESEFFKWLGRKSKINQKDALEASPFPDLSNPSSRLIKRQQINVLGSSKDEIISEMTKIVICSYGLAPNLVNRGRLYPGQFQCAIVDESHMLKNKASKRTAALIPVLSSTKRCVLLSGTPALARPIELWPQLCILGTERHGWWDNEEAFKAKYVKNVSSRRRAELHALMTGTVMIRRLKNDILKSMRPKRREKAEINILSKEARAEFKSLLVTLRSGNGLLAKLAQRQHAREGNSAEEEEIVASEKVEDASIFEKRTLAVNQLREQMRTRREDGFKRIQDQLLNERHRLSQEGWEELKLELQGKLRHELEKEYNNGMKEIENKYSEAGAASREKEQLEKTKVLTRLFSLSGESKINFMADMLRRWLDDRTKGKICIFAHHISVLKGIEKKAGLSNSKRGRKFIKILGSISPKERQKAIETFQEDPTVRVALLGITAAGVGVTLTASATVWFAELFWTPALLLQAEDRCHRIGQQAQVTCLYFVARGTLDEILWNLIEKKFQDLGEFVEGKERLKMVVDKIYKNISQLHSIFNVPELDLSEEQLDPDDDLLEDLNWDGDLTQVIEELGANETQMLRPDNDDDDEPVPIDPDSKPSASARDASKPLAAAAAKGQTEEAAIELTDDEDDEGDGAESEDPFKGQLKDYKLYRIYIKGPVLGLTLSVLKGRPCVTSVGPQRLARLGPESRPCVGDVLVMVNSRPVPNIDDIGRLLRQMQIYLGRGMVELCFVEAPAITAVIKMLTSRGLEAAPKPPAPKPPTNDVIELVDDDD